MRLGFTDIRVTIQNKMAAFQDMLRHESSVLQYTADVCNAQSEAARLDLQETLDHVQAREKAADEREEALQHVEKYGDCQEPHLTVKMVSDLEDCMVKLITTVNRLIVDYDLPVIPAHRMDFHEKLDNQFAHVQITMADLSEVLDRICEKMEQKFGVLHAKATAVGDDAARKDQELRDLEGKQEKLQAQVLQLAELLMQAQGLRSPSSHSQAAVEALVSSILPHLDSTGVLLTASARKTATKRNTGISCASTA